MATISGALFLALSALWGALALPLLLLAWHAARQGRTQLHRRLMVLVLAGTWTFVAAYLLFYRHHPDKAPVAEHMVLWLRVHGLLGLLATLGASALLLGRSLPKWAASSWLNRHHRRLGRIAVVLWLVTYLGGLFNYALV